MAYNIDESINVQGSPKIGVWHEPEFKKYQIFSNNNGTIILLERLSKETYGDYINVLYTLSTTTDRCNEILNRVEEKLNLINTLSE